MNQFQKFHTKNDWENIDVTSINREQSHAQWGAYENAEQAGSCNQTISKWTKCKVEGTDFKVTFDKTTGAINSYLKKGVECIFVADAIKQIPGAKYGQTRFRIQV